MRRILALAVSCLGMTSVFAMPSWADSTPAVASSASSAASDAKPRKVKVAYIDYERCLGEIEDGLRARSLLKKFGDKRQQAVLVMEDRLKAQQERIQKIASDKGASSVLAAEMTSQQKDLALYNDMLKRVNAEIAVREEELFAPIERKMKTIFAKVADADGYDLLIDKKFAPAGRAALDVSEKVIFEYNWAGKSPGKTPAAAPSASK